MYPNGQFLAHFVVHMPLCLHVLFRVAGPLQRNRRGGGGEGTVIWGMFPRGREGTVARRRLLCNGGGRGGTQTFAPPPLSPPPSTTSLGPGAPAVRPTHCTGGLTCGAVPHPLQRRGGRGTLAAPPQVLERCFRMVEHAEQEASGLRISPTTPYETLLESVERTGLAVKPGERLVDQPDEPLFRVTVFPGAEKGSSAVTVDISHVVADGHTYYRIFNMLGQNVPPQTLNVMRKQEMSCCGGPWREVCDCSACVRLLPEEGGRHTNPRGSANAETTPAGARAAAADIESIGIDH